MSDKTLSAKDNPAKKREGRFVEEERRILKARGAKPDEIDAHIENMFRKPKKGAE
jgi:hypothetical protein